MSKRDNLLLQLEDMLQSAHKIKLYTMDFNFNMFLDDNVTIDAVVRNFELIGDV